MGENYYFTKWIQHHSKEEMKKLCDIVLKNVTCPVELMIFFNKDEFSFTYFTMVYLIVTMNLLGFTIPKIRMVLDIAIGPGTSKYFNPKRILDIHMDAIPELEKYIKEDYKNFYLQ